MPIRPENKGLYPANWKEVVEETKLTGTRWYALNADGEKVAEGGRDA